MLNILHEIVNSKFIFLQIILFKCLAHRKAVKKYHMEYKKFLHFTIKKFPKNLYSSTQIPIFPVKNQHDYEKREKLLLPSNTVYIIGEKTFYKFAAVKCILRRIVQYEELLTNYMSRLDSSLIRLVNGMNDFRSFYIHFIDIISSNNSAASSCNE